MLKNQKIKKSKTQKHKNTKTQKHKNSIQTGGFYVDEFKQDLIDSAIKINNLNMHAHKLDLNNLLIINTPEDIIENFKQNNYLELRPYNGEKRLIIACGNKRLDDGNTDKITYMDKTIELNKYHSHRDAYTIDLFIGANPSIVSQWGDVKIYTNLLNGIFDIIIFEGGGSAKDNVNEIKRLLNPNNLSFCIETVEGDYKICYYYSEGTFYTVNESSK